MKLAVKQWYAQSGQADWRRMQILEFIDKHTLRYMDCYANGTFEQRITNSIQWAWDVRRGALILVDPPDENWMQLPKGGTDGKTKEEGRQSGKGAGVSKRGRR